MTKARLVARGFDPSDLITDIAALQAQVAALQLDINDLDTTVAALSGTVSGFNGRIGTLESKPLVYSSRVDQFANYPIGTPSQNWWRSAHAIDITGQTPAGSVWLCLGQGQGRTEWDFNVECIARVGWSSPALAVDRPGGQESNGMSDFYIVGSNRRQTREHYFEWQRVGIHVFGSTYSTVRFHNDVRFKSSDPSIDGSGNQVLFAGTGQGGILVMRLK